MGTRTSPHTPLVYQATFRGMDGAPVRPRPELNEDRPHHADSLRYDLAFHSPADTSLVIFPWFKHKTDGSYPFAITVARWHSYGIVLRAVANHHTRLYIDQHPVGDWITYQHPDGNHGLEPTTMDDWLRVHPGVSLRGWRNIPELMAAKYWAVTG
jgi:hypothetical protein